MDKFVLEYFRAGLDYEIIEAESIFEAAEIAEQKNKGGFSLTPFDVWDDIQNPPKMYKVEIEKKTGDNLADFLSWAETYLDGPEEVENTAESIGSFCLEYMGKDCDNIPVLFIEDRNGNIIEYFIFTDSETLRHEKIELD